MYQITCATTGKFYVGSAASLQNRFGLHRSQLRRGVHCNKHLQRAWVKHGEAAFVFTVLLLCEKRDTLMYEQLAIDTLAPEFNICRVAGSQLGRKLTEEHRAKLRKIAAENREANRAQALARVTPELRKQLSERASGKNNPWYGKPRPRETVQKIMASRRNNGESRKYLLYGELVSPMDVQERFGLHRTTFESRVKSGWPVEDAVRSKDDPWVKAKASKALADRNRMLAAARKVGG